jgi:hypothetical protein
LQYLSLPSAQYHGLIIAGNLDALPWAGGALPGACCVMAPLTQPVLVAFVDTVVTNAEALFAGSVSGLKDDTTARIV